MRKIYSLLLITFSVCLSKTIHAQVSGYTFAQSSGTYSAISGGTASTATSDDGTQNVAIGFNFSFGGVSYPNIIISTNGAAKLAPDGTTGFSSGWTNNLSNSYGSAIIAPLWDDNNATGGSIVYQLSGSAPNRTFSVEWQNIHLGGGGSTSTLTGTFKITLYETTNVVKIEYGTINATTITSASIGLNDLTSFLSVTPGTPATTSSSTANNTISSLALLVSGLTYTFTPPSCTSPSALVPTALGQTTATIGWTASGTASSYNWELRASGACGSGSPIQSGATTGTSVSLTGLSPQTTYTLCVSSTCAGPSSSSWVSITFTTPCLAVNVPYTEDFNSVSTPNIPSCTSIQDLNGGTTWTTVSGVTGFTGNTLRYTYSSSLPGNDWFYITGVNLTGGKTYKLKYRYGNNSTFFSERMEVRYGTSPVASAMTTTLKDYPNIIGNSPGNDSVTFIPAASGVYYIGFHSYSIADEFYLHLDDISLAELPAADITVTALTIPAVYCPSPTTYSYTATIKNAGIAPLDFSTNPATITATVSGAGTGSLTATINTGTLAVGATQDVALSPSYAFTNSGTYNFTVLNNTFNDGNALNDTLRASKNISALPNAELGPDIDTCVVSTYALSSPTQPAGSSYLWNTGATTQGITVSANGLYKVTITGPPVQGTVVKTFNANIPTPVNITDNNTTVPTNIQLPVSGLNASTISTTSIKEVCLTITHTWDSDLDIYLLSPSGTLLELSTDNGSSGDNYTNTCFSPTASTPVTSGAAPFTGTFLPEGSFSSLNGGNANGTWTLQVYDDLGGDVGSISAFSIAFNDLSPIAGSSCTAADSTNIIIRKKPNLNLGPDGVICQGSSRTLNGNGSTTGETYLWAPGNQSTQTISVTAAGSYSVRVSNTAGCTARDTINLVISPLPTVTLSLPFDTLYLNSPITLVAGGSPAGGIYSGTGITPSASPSINPAAYQQGTHQVTYTYTNSDNCKASATDVFTVIAAANRVNIYPNPSLGDNVIVVVSPEFVGGIITLYNQAGQKVQQLPIGGRQNAFSTKLSAGRYVVVVQNGTEMEQKQLVITR